MTNLEPAIITSKLGFEKYLQYTKDHLTALYKGRRCIIAVTGAKPSLYPCLCSAVPVSSMSTCEEIHMSVFIVAIDRFTAVDFICRTSHRDMDNLTKNSPLPILPHITLLNSLDPLKS